MEFADREVMESALFGQRRCVGPTARFSGIKFFPQSGKRAIVGRSHKSQLIIMHAVGSMSLVDASFAMPAATNKPGSQRLRASCDRCHQAKLKCRFENPSSCVRCTKKKTACSRSPVLPLGRAPGSRNKPKSSASDCPYPTPEDTASSSLSSPPPKSLLNHRRSESPDCENHFGCVSESAQTITPALSSTDAFTDLDCAALSPHFSTIDFDWCETEDLNDTQLDIVSTASAPQADFLVQSPSPPSEPLGCSCLFNITEAKDNLQLGTAGARPTDDVLRLNSLALAALENFIACETAHDLALVLFVYLVLQRILAAYTELWFIASAPTAASCAAPGRPKDPGLQMGSYTFNEEDERALKQRIIVLGLQKFTPVLDQLEKRVASNCEDNGRGTFSSMHGFLKKQVDDITWRIVEMGF